MKPRDLLLAPIAAGLVTLLGLSQAIHAAHNELPPFEKIWQTVETQLAKLPNYEPGDLISRSQVEPIFPLLKKLGWEVRDQDEILNLLPIDSEYFVKQMRTKSGLVFMRQIETYPLSFDRMDRLGQMSMGNRNIDALIRGPDGYKMLQYMTETSWGKNLGTMLSQAPRGKDFNAPTGRLYTADQLMLKLQQSYEEELKRRGLEPQAKR